MRIPGFTAEMSLYRSKDELFIDRLTWLYVSSRIDRTPAAARARLRRLRCIHLA